MKHTNLFTAVALITIAGCAGDRVEEQNIDHTAALVTISKESTHSISPAGAGTTTVEREKIVAAVRPAMNDIAKDSAQIHTGDSRHRIEQQQVLRSYDRSASHAAESVAMIAKARRSRDIVLPYPTHHQDREKYLEIDANRIAQTSAQAVSTFSIDVDTAAYSNVRRMLNREGRLPPENAVKVEEFINYFDYAYQPPDQGEQPFSVHTEIAPSPWNANTHLLKVGLKGYQPDVDDRPAANLVFLIDVSGSMRAAQKLGLVKQSLRLLVNQMRPEDRVAIAVYAGAAGLALESTAGSQQAKILAAIDGLEAGGSTNGGAGIKLAYNIAAQHLVEGGINRVIIASDGDMNVGTVNHEALKDLIEHNRERGIALTTLGYGGGNYNYALMEEMADVGNGNAAYIDSLKEAHKVLVKEMGSTLQTIAKDVKIQIEFNPSLVAEYRLIGYENRLLNREDFRNDKVDAGEIGVGHTVTALYEIALVGSGGERLEPLRYGKPESHEAAVGYHTNELGELRLRYKEPGGSVSRELRQVFTREQIIPTLDASSTDFRFAAAVAGFGQLLRGGKHTGVWSYDNLLQLARSAKGEDNHGYRGEMLALVELSRDLNGVTTPRHDS